MDSPFLFPKKLSGKVRKGWIRTVFSAALAALLFSFDFVYAAGISSNEIVTFANAERTRKGMNILAISPELTKAAQQKADDMLDKHYFAHYSPYGATPWDFILGNGYDYVFAGENLAMDFERAQDIHNAWMRSPLHAGNILDGNFEDIGVAVAKGEIDNHETTVVVQMFGKRKRSFYLDFFSRDLVFVVNKILGVEQ